MWSVQEQISMQWEVRKKEERENERKSRQLLEAGKALLKSNDKLLKSINYSV